MTLEETNKQKNNLYLPFRRPICNRQKKRETNGN